MRSSADQVVTDAAPIAHEAAEASAEASRIEGFILKQQHLANDLAATIDLVAAVRFC